MVRYRSDTSTYSRRGGRNWDYKNEVRGGVLAWLSVWSEVQMICIWSSWCHCHLIISCFIKIQIGLIFLVPAYPGCPEKEAVKCLSVCLSVCLSYLYTSLCNRLDSAGLPQNRGILLAVRMRCIVWEGYILSVIKGKRTFAYLHLSKRLLNCHLVKNRFEISWPTVKL